MYGNDNDNDDDDDDDDGRERERGEGRRRRKKLIKKNLYINNSKHQIHVKKKYIYKKLQKNSKKIT